MLASWLFFYDWASSAITDEATYVVEPVPNVYVVPEPATPVEPEPVPVVYVVQ